MIASLFIIVGVIIMTGHGNVVDVENTAEILDLFGVHFITSPGSPFDFDVVPSIPPPNRNEFILRLRVRTAAYTHVALSTNNQQDMYDIAFGVKKNRYTIVSQCSAGACEEMGAVFMAEAVSGDQIQDLWIGYDFNAGIIQVGRGSDSIPRMEVMVQNPLRLVNFGFSTSIGFQGYGYWWLPQDYLVQSCGSLLYETDSVYSHRYTLPLIPMLSSMDFEFDFYAMAAADVRILLASEVGLANDETAYEIVIGSSSNTESEIRRCKIAIECCPSLASARTPQILSEREFEKFTIRYNNGLLKVFAGDDETPFLVTRDPSPISIRTVGYSTGPYNGGVFGFPSKGIMSGLLVFDTEAGSPLNLDLPLIPEDKAHNIDLRFLVKAQQSVVFAISPVSNINSYNGPLYEIVIGGWNNARTTVSLCKGCASRKSIDHRPLDANAFRHFRINIQNGYINVYEDQGDQSSIDYQDSNPIQVRAVGFTTTNGASGRFVFSTCNLY